MTNEELYGPVPKLSEKVKIRRLSWRGTVISILICHQHRNQHMADETLDDLQRRTLLTTLIEDAEVESRDELAKMLTDREMWRVKRRARLKF